jgi:hypothetical protein
MSAGADPSIVKEPVSSKGTKVRPPERKKKVKNIFDVRKLITQIINKFVL